MALAAEQDIKHIRIDEDGVAWIVGANTKVVEVVLDWLAYGWSPAEIHWQHPHLSLAQVHSAFSYYYDHQTGIDAQIRRDHQEVARMRAESGESLFEDRMRAEGRLP